MNKAERDQAIDTGMLIVKECTFLDISIKELVTLGDHVHKLILGAIEREQLRCADIVREYILPMEGHDKAVYETVEDCKDSILQQIFKKGE